MHAKGEKRTKRVRRILRIAVLATTGALLIQAATVAGEDVAAESGGARAVEAGRRSDPAARQSPQAALKYRIDEMHERRRGHRQQRDEKLRRLTPDERRRRIEPRPLPRRPRNLDAALERVNTLRRRLGGPTIAVRR